mgnify:FL=1
MGRGDGHHLSDIKSFHKFYTFVMPTRTAAIVWHEVVVDFSNTLDFLNRKKREGHDITIFQLVVSALLRTASQFPEINRFIYNHKFYARHEYSASFNVNKNDQMIMCKIFCEPEEDILTVSKKVKEIVDGALTKAPDTSDKILDVVMKLPDFLISLIAKLYPWLVEKGILSYDSFKDNPLFSSAVISDIGSFGLNSLYHHLYDWGNTSVFVTIGAMHKAPVVTPESTLKVSDVIKFGFSIDERLCDGNKLSNMLLFFKDCLENPSVLEKPPLKVIRE